MIRVRGLISSIKSSLLTNKNAFQHKIQQSWESQFNQKNPKLNYLGKLLENNTIRPYFIQKDIKQLQQEDIYFYISNKQLFQQISKETKPELIKNPNASTILKFHVALQLNTLRNQQIQQHLLQSFNTSINKMSTSDVLFCLQLITSFRNVNESINYYELEKKFLKDEDSVAFVRFVYLMSQLEFKLEMISNDLIQEKITLIDNLSPQTIFHIKSLASFYQITLSQVCQKRLRSSFMAKRKNFTELQASYIVELLHYYPESVNLLDIQNFNVQAYTSFLEFFIPENEQENTQSIPVPIPHRIPLSILQKAETFQLYRIIKHRVTLQLQTPQSLVENVKDYYTPNLNCVIAIIRYLEKEDKMTPQAESYLEKSVYNKIIKLGDKVFQDFSIVDVFKILGYFSVNNLGTINFWKKSLKFVTDSIADTQNYKNLSGQEQKKFVVYLFQIFKNKPFPRQLEDQIINLTLLSLTINQWTLKQVLPLTISLKVNKISDNELWFGIQQRIKKIGFRHMESHQDRRFLKKIVINFNMIGKGSYQFWSQVNKNLNRKQKTQILNLFKIPSTLAHTYLKV